MSAERIDVLAVLDAEIAFIREGIGRGDEMVHLEMTRHERVKVAEIRAGLMERLARTQDARAAVAELIGFAEGMRELLSQDGAPVWAAGALDQLQSVLARVQGAQS